MPVLVGAERPQSDERQFRSVGEAARVFGVSEMTLYRAIHEGKFPALRIMGRLIVPLRAIEAMVSAAVENTELVDTADWVNLAAERAGLAQVPCADDSRDAGRQYDRGLLDETPTAGRTTRTRLGARQRSTRERSNGRKGR